jgi:Protein of unknown function (DUF4235)
VKLIYKPFGIVMGLLAGLVSKRIFDFIWARFDDAEAPKPTTREANWPKILGAAAVQGMVFKTTRAVVDRQGARSFEFLTGTWPGEQRPDPKGIDIGKK